jgi:hypothetical protein
VVDAWKREEVMPDFFVAPVNIRRENKFSARTRADQPSSYSIIVCGFV